MAEDVMLVCIVEGWVKFGRWEKTRPFETCGGSTRKSRDTLREVVNIGLRYASSTRYSDVFPAPYPMWSHPQQPISKESYTTSDGWRKRDPS